MQDDTTAEYNKPLKNINQSSICDFDELFVIEMIWLNFTRSLLIWWPVFIDTERIFLKFIFRGRIANVFLKS